LTIDTVKIFKNEQNKHALVSKKLEKRPVKTGEDRPVWKVRPDRIGPDRPVRYRSTGPVPSLLQTSFFFQSRARRYGTVLLSRGTVRYAVLDSYTALSCCHKKNNLLTMISDNIYLISLFALDVNRNLTKITRINYLSISYSRLFHFNFV